MSFDRSDDNLFLTVFPNKCVVFGSCRMKFKKNDKEKFDVKKPPLKILFFFLLLNDLFKVIKCMAFSKEIQNSFLRT